MKHIIYALLCAMLCCFAFVSCDKDNETSEPEFKIQGDELMVSYDGSNWKSVGKLQGATATQSQFKIEGENLMVSNDGTTWTSLGKIVGTNENTIYSVAGKIFVDEDYSDNGIDFSLYKFNSYGTFYYFNHSIFYYNEETECSDNTYEENGIYYADGHHIALLYDGDSEETLCTLALFNNKLNIYRRSEDPISQETDKSLEELKIHLNQKVQELTKKYK